ncbi:MAG: hypothetical protein WKF47_10855 [Geodermatophilaceae bacterium]
MDLETRPIGPHSWDDVAAVFAASSGSRDCWCMQWRTAAAAYQRNGADGNRAALRELVESGAPVGAYVVQDSLRALLSGTDPDVSRVGIALAAVSLLVMPLAVTGTTAYGQGFGLCRSRRRRDADAAVRLPVGGPAGRAAAQRRARLGLGRPARRAGHRGGRGQGGPRDLAGRELLRPGRRWLLLKSALAVCGLAAVTPALLTRMRRELL